MTPKELAEQLTGAEYPLAIDRKTKAAAKAAGLVIVYGASDDLMEVDGAISDEIGAYEGATVIVDAEGLMPEWDVMDPCDRQDKEFMRNYFRREGRGREIEALWNAEEGYSWTYKTDIPHETFEIVEDGEPYCRGIVFRLVDAAGGKE